MFRVKRKLALESCSILLGKTLKIFVYSVIQVIVEGLETTGVCVLKGKDIQLQAQSIFVSPHSSNEGEAGGDCRVT